MYLRPFLVIQILAFLTTQIWAYFRLRSFAQEFMSKLEALATSGYIPIPLPGEMSDYLHISSLAKAGTFFTFTFGFTLGVVAFAGFFCLNHYRLSIPIRLGWTVLISAFFSFLLGFSPIEPLLFIAFFGVAHLAIRIPDAPFQKVALLSLVPLILVFVIYLAQNILLVRDYRQDFLVVRDDLLQSSWGRRVVAFYYRYSPMSAELITPPAKRTQFAIWTGTPLGKTEKSWLLKRGIYPVLTEEGVDLALAGQARTGPEVLEAVQNQTPAKGAKSLRKTIFYSIFVAAPLAIMLCFVFATERLLALSKHSRRVLVVCVASLSAFLIYYSLSRRGRDYTDTLPKGNVEEIRHWVVSAKKAGDLRARDNFIRHLGNKNPAVRLWAATALAHLPSKDNVEILKITASRDPVAIVRCKAIFALSHQGDKRVMPFLESRLKGGEDWYVKHYLLRALRRLGWIG